MPLRLDYPTVGQYAVVIVETPLFVGQHDENQKRRMEAQFALFYDQFLFAIIPFTILSAVSFPAEYLYSTFTSKRGLKRNSTRQIIV